MSTFTQKIEDTQKALDAARGDIAELMGMAEAEGRDLSDPESVQLEVLAEEVTKCEKRIASLELAEQALAVKAVNKVAVVKAQHLGGKERPPGDLHIKHATAAYIAHVERKNILDVLSERYSDDHGLQAIVKTAINPAATDVAGWAQELTQDANMGYLELLRGSSIAAQLWGSAGMMLNFDGYTAINVPKRAGSTTDLASGWTGQGSAIPVRRATFATQPIQPYKWGAITTMTREVMIRSTPAIEGIIRSGMIADTATKLDNDYLGSAALNAGFSPAGIFNGVTGTAAATGGTTPADDMLKDIQNLLTPIYAANMGQNLFIVMHPTVALAMSSTIANGVYIFKNELTAGTLAGVPVIVSTNCTVTEMLALDMAQHAIASGPMEFSVSDSATIVEVNDDVTAPNMSADYPRAPVTGAVGGTGGAHTTTPPSPVRSLWQTDTVAIRLLQILSWANLRTGSVNKITGISY